MNQAGISRGFAFVDYVTAEEAERGQKAHNGALLEGTNVRVAYGTPGRTGASILGGHHNTNLVLYMYEQFGELFSKHYFTAKIIFLLPF